MVSTKGCQLGFKSQEPGTKPQFQTCELDTLPTLVITTKIILLSLLLVLPTLWCSLASCRCLKEIEKSPQKNKKISLNNFYLQSLIISEILVIFLFYLITLINWELLWDFWTLAQLMRFTYQTSEVLQKIQYWKFAPNRACFCQFCDAATLAITHKRN
jgi:hypothetical protein